MIYKLKSIWKILTNKIEKGDIVVIKDNYNQETIVLITKVYDNNIFTIKLIENNSLSKDIFKEVFKEQIIKIIPKNTFYFKDKKYYYI